MSQYKLVALDMDGTLLNEEKQVSPANREAIYAALEAGVTVIFSTGRGVQSALPYAEELKLQTPIVSVNGSEVWKAPHDLLKRTLLDLDLVRRMYDLAIEHDTWYWAYSVEGMYNRDKWAEDITKPEWLKFGFYTENKESLEIIRGELARWGELEITNSHPDNLELNPKGISKASGIEEVCKLLGIEMSQVIAMGDSENDIAMIRAAGLGVAMGNAQDGVKRIADLVTVTNDEDGVAKIIQEYVLDPLSAR
ncbi:HAD family phosphatase [Paenibacillus chitinolyticus]|uniref:Cof-type HAD-IIB family hydrolase n=1 Tax=Paenibacillus chitinolyticus TaxID=79263 RepID=A0A410X2P8_9BACL|nr:Cof-type HAD-IIB family hydrolase [Paenibacillus chitinolyticus]MCY9591377.1 Cof-type HAD-IIB family hydrolase [Paenibacillus chitinolyticus]MCY9599366.1 Cof-type HAD-IIB family hydrolase [Paenibacillus chitinolyticus]QAV20877.1 HAD family phosphatase [Paenibacillus chitinolyticus]